MKRISTHFGKSVFTLAVIAVIATLMMLAACISGTVPGASSSTGFPYIQSITAQIVSGPATPGATSGATSAATPGATASVTPGATSAATPGATGATSAATPGATSPVTPGATSAATPGATSATTPGATSAATPGATSTATPGATSTPATGGANVMISIQAANFTVVNNLGQAAVQGQGHVHYYMDATPPISAGLPAISAPGTVVEIAATSYTWPNVQPGLHVFSVQLVNNDHTPLSAPAVAAVLCVVPSTTGSSTPAITMYTTQIMPSSGAAASATPGTTSAATPSATMTTTPGATSAVTPGATAAATPSATASPSSTATSAAGAGGVSIMQMIQVSNFSIIDKQGQASVAGQGHVHFYLDSVPATFPNIPAIGPAGTWVHIAAPSYTWNNVSPGVHILSVELVNNDHTPLNPPVVMTSEVVVMPSSATASPAASASATASPSRAPTTTSTTASPAASPSATATSAASPTSTAAASPTSTSAAGGPATINLVAQNVAFNMKTITVRAGAQVTVNFNNMDSGIPHNFAIYTDQSATKSIFVGQIVTGPATMTYTFTAPSTPGTYFFRCDVHPTIMTGQFIVQ